MKSDPSSDPAGLWREALREAREAKSGDGGPGGKKHGLLYIIDINIDDNR